MFFIDRFALDAKEVRKTQDGYIVANPRVARTGIQIYAGREVGRPDLTTVRVYRSPEEVFSKDSLASFAFKPLTDDHPKKPVNADNWKDHATGQFGGEVARDGDFVRIPMVMMDATAIKKFETGKAELSVGYNCDLKWESGKTPDGLEYDAKQTDIRANHIAQVKDARGGRKLRIGDEKSPLLLSDGDTLTVAPLLDWYVADETSADAVSTAIKDGTTERSTTMKILMIDGVSCSFTDEQSAQIAQRALDAATAAAKTATDKVAALTADAFKSKEELEKEKEEKKKELEAKDAEIAALKQKVADSTITTDKLNQMVADRADCVGKAKVVLGDKAPKDIETMDGDAIKKLVVDTKLGDTAKGWDANSISVAFTSLTSDVKPQTAPAGNGFQNVADTAAALAAAKPFNKDAAQQAYDKRLTNAWKNPAGLPTAN